MTTSALGAFPTSARPLLRALGVLSPTRKCQLGSYSVVSSSCEPGTRNVFRFMLNCQCSHREMYCLAVCLQSRIFGNFLAPDRHPARCPTYR